MVVRLRELPSGLLVAPRRGAPPPCPDGYLRVEGYPYMFTPILADCRYRQEDLVNNSCCKNSPELRCYLSGTPAHTTPAQCQACDKRVPLEEQP